MTSFPQNKEEKKFKSDWPKKREFEGMEVQFFKIKNEILGEIFEDLLSSSGGVRSTSLKESDYNNRKEYEDAVVAMETTATLKAMGDPKMKKARNVFFEHMNIVGIGFVDKNLDDILEDDLSYSMLLFNLGIEVYLGKHLAKLSERESSK